ncbi:Nuclear autoantigenic sperm protein [Liparis tanakae]|uniref:Nuclear autoantigenic sperm protein n=1 Tax=Liparis tanakae TaxID=230148 RepID=A0A4Z2F1D7_9TELE|nr:Nuclear autoantigenic sperm protein [Liparis tanakae]
MAAQTYLKLGEVSAESGNYPQALEDFQECLALQLRHLPPHSRLLAETHYHVATTLCYMDQYSPAIQHYGSSITVIEARLAVLQDAGVAEEKNEMEELQQLLPDIREKIEDAKESQRTSGAASHAIQQTLGGASTSTSSAAAFRCENGGASSSFPAASQIPVKSSAGASAPTAVSNISHLVRKKRKPEEESPVKDTGAKQAKQEATVNGADSSASKGVQEGKSQEASARIMSHDPRCVSKTSDMERRDRCPAWMEVEEMEAHVARPPRRPPSARRRDDLVSVPDLRHQRSVYPALQTSAV